MLKYKYKPEISTRAFWDTDVDSLDYEKDAAYIIKSVFNYGRVEDIIELLVCYGNKAVKDVICNATYLDGTGRDMALAIFDIRPEKLKCYSKKPYHLSY